MLHHLHRGSQPAATPYQRRFAAQTRLPDELIVCDDRSTDLTAGIIDGFPQKADFPVHLYANRDNLGATKNFEKAIEYCAEDIIVLSDQDDVWHPKKLQRIEQVLSSTPRIGAVFTDAEAVEAQLRPLGYRLWQYFGFGREQQKPLCEGAALDILLKHNVVIGATLAFRANTSP